MSTKYDRGQRWSAHCPVCGREAHLRETNAGGGICQRCRKAARKQARSSNEPVFENSGLDRKSVV